MWCSKFRSCTLLQQNCAGSRQKVKVKVKVKLSLCLTKHHAICIGGVEVQLHAFLTSAVDEGEW